MNGRRTAENWQRTVEILGGSLGAGAFGLAVGVGLLLVLGLIVNALGIKPEKQRLLYESIGLEYRPGVFVSSDYLITNKTGEDLSDVHIWIEATGINGETKVMHQYWARWKQGETKIASALFSQNQSVEKLQKLRLHGHTSKYQFDFDFKFTWP